MHQAEIIRQALEDRDRALSSVDGTKYIFLGQMNSPQTGTKCINIEPAAPRAGLGIFLTNKDEQDIGGQHGCRGCENKRDLGEGVVSKHMRRMALAENKMWISDGSIMIAGVSSEHHQGVSDRRASKRSAQPLHIQPSVLV